MCDIYWVRTLARAFGTGQPAAVVASGGGLSAHTPARRLRSRPAVDRAEWEPYSGVLCARRRGLKLQDRRQNGAFRFPCLGACPAPCMVCRMQARGQCLELAAAAAGPAACSRDPVAARRSRQRQRAQRRVEYLPVSDLLSLLDKAGCWVKVGRRTIGRRRCRHQPRQRPRPPTVMDAPCCSTTNSSGASPAAAASAASSAGGSSSGSARAEGGGVTLGLAAARACGARSRCHALALHARHRGAQGSRRP
jgi:hypothetical protein